MSSKRQYMYQKSLQKPAVVTTTGACWGIFSCSNNSLWFSKRLLQTVFVNFWWLKLKKFSLSSKLWLQWRLILVSSVATERGFSLQNKIWSHFFQGKNQEPHDNNRCRNPTFWLYFSFTGGRRKCSSHSGWTGHILSAIAYLNFLYVVIHLACSDRILFKIMNTIKYDILLKVDGEWQHLSFSPRWSK